MKKKIPVQPQITVAPKNDLEMFQAEHGADWQRITNHPAFLGGLQLLNIRAFNELTSLSFEDIDKYGALILSVLVGRLKHENDMMNLHKEQTFTFPQDEDTVYISPEEQAEHERVRAQFSEKKAYG